MRLPKLQSTRSETKVLSAFGGYNANERIQDGEFSDMQNMTADYYPILSPRIPRGKLRDLTDCKGLYGTDKLVWVTENKLYYNQSEACDLKESCKDKERTFVRMGAYLCVFPDKVMYNVYDQTLTDMENKVITTTKPSFTLCKMDGTVFPEKKTYTGDTEPDKTQYEYWIDTSENTVVMKIWSENSAAWVSVGTTYVKIQSPGIGKGFKEYDAATFSGVDKRAEIYNNYDFNTSNILYGCGDDYVIVIGLINKVFTNSENITISRTVPDMDFVTEMDNRLWGCSSANHEIYACKLGDPKNWRCYMGLSSDSYAVTVGSEGDFTGAISYYGSVLFFKEGGVHKVFGDKPSNYELSWKPMRGVQLGSEKSLIVLNEVLYYKSRDGICAYSGSTPSKISGNLGKEMYYDAVAGGYRDKYYVCMRDELSNYWTYVYDITKGIWTKEDEGIKKAFAYSDGGLYFLDENNSIWVINYEQIFMPIAPLDNRFGEQYMYPGEWYPGAIPVGEEEEKQEWYAVTGDMGLDSIYNKYIRELVIRLEIEADAYFRIEIMYDSENWQKVMEYTGTKKRSYQVPVRIKRCDHFKLRLSGNGAVKVYSIAQMIQEGSVVSG